MKIKHEKTLNKPVNILTKLSSSNGESESEVESLHSSEKMCVQLARIQCLTIAPNLVKLAVCQSNTNHILLYDLTTGEERDRFALKSASISTNSSANNSANSMASKASNNFKVTTTVERRSFVVNGMVFSTESDRLAIGQSDCVIYIYRLGLGWGEKKSIVNKFNLASPVCSLYWLPTGLIFSSIDARIKCIHTQTNKVYCVITGSPLGSAMCVSLACNQEYILAGFFNGSIMLNSVHGRESTARTVAQHTCAPFALVLTSTGFICAAGSDGLILFQEVIGTNGEIHTSQQGSASGSTIRGSSSNSRTSSVMSSATNGSGQTTAVRQTIEWGSNISNALSSPSGTIVTLCSGENLLVFRLEQARVWKHNMTINLAGSMLITGLCWSNDGTKLVISSLNGAVELFRVRWKTKMLCGGRFEVNYIGPRQVVINDVKEKYTFMFQTNYDIQDVKIFKENFVIIWTMGTLIMSTLESEMNPIKRKSEIEWHGLTMRGIKFSFDYENVVLICAVGELFLVELGQDRILGSVRTDFISPHLLSVRINERKSNTKLFAYLLDVYTISVIDLITNLQVCTWTHNERIDWFELNETGNKLIYRDKALKLVLLNIINQEYVVLLNFCGFVQWVPGSDVVVAQSKDKLYIWYDFERPIINSISGGEANDAIEIERANGCTKVKFTLPGTDVQLDEVLLEFDTALDDGDLNRAEAFLESLTDNDIGNPNVNSVDIKSMWLHLGNIALKQLNLAIGKRAFAAVGDIAKVAFIQQCQDDSALCALLDHDWDRFETCGQFQQVIDTYVGTYNWDRAIEFCGKHDRNDLVEQIESQYYEWLLQTGQNSIAAKILEKAGRMEEAIALYLKSGRMTQMTKLIVQCFDHQDSTESTLVNTNIIRKAIEELNQTQAFEEVGDLYQLPVIDQKEKALESYVKAKAFAKAIQLARQHFPDNVVNIESQYGEYLLNEIDDPASAVNHFIEAGKTDRALEAAISARQFDRAAEIAAIMDHVPSIYGKKIADHYAARDELEPALEMYLAAGCIRDAVTMLNTKGQYARAYKLAKKLMDQNEAKEMYEYIAKSFEHEQKYREAEKIYIACGDVDSAISMHKNAKQYEHMIRLVKQYHPDLLNETCIYLAKELEANRMYKQAETYYISVKEWQMAALMYKNAELWEDAYRVSRAHGGTAAAKQVAYHWAQTMNTPADAVSLLNRYGLLNQVVDYALEINNYDFVLMLIHASGNDLKHKLIDVQLKYALWLEQEGHYHEAEAMFIEANKLKEAVVMYLHANNFDEALRVAEMTNNEEIVRDVLTAHARFLFERDRQEIQTGTGSGSISTQFSTTLSKVESLLLRAGRIEVAIRLYKEIGLWNEALRTCEQYAPHMIESLKREMITEASENSELYSYSSNANSVRDGSSISKVVSGNKGQLTGYAESTVPQEDLYQALKVAEQNDDKESIIRYTILLATQLLKDRFTLESLHMLRKHDTVFIIADSKKLLSRIAVTLLSEMEDVPKANEDDVVEQSSRVQIFVDLRDCLAQLLSINSSLNNVEQDLFEKYLLISHYLALRFTLETFIQDDAQVDPHNQSIMRELHFKITVALLRYTDLIRADKAFYEAGIAARKANRLEMAFVFLNHFLDLLDAIEEHDYNVDHSDFLGTDIPYEVPLPSRNDFNHEIIDEIKGWILQTSMDTEMSQSLPLDPLRDGEVYEASLINIDQTRCLPCLVTGYPVIKHKAIVLKPGKYAANKEDWNKLLMLAKVTESKQLRDILHFIGRLCGNTAIVKFSFQ